MRPLTSQFSASVARRDQVVKNTWVGAVPRTAVATASASSRSAANGSMPSPRLLGSRQSPETCQPSSRRRRARLPPLIPVTPTTSARSLMGRPSADERELGEAERRSCCLRVCADRAPPHLAVDKRGGDDQEALEDVLPFLV